MMAYDIACLDLAEHFLLSTAPDRLKTQLAQVIQDAVEDWIEKESERLRTALAAGLPKQ